jgi:mRNA-degrading endonuclease RelE of RelBE toxin-antitoxin system
VRGAVVLTFPWCRARDRLGAHEEDPFPQSQGDKEKLVLKGGIIIYRLHISRRYTVFYEIDKEEKLVIVQEILPIEQAHKKYGYY